MPIPYTPKHDPLKINRVKSYMKRIVDKTEAIEKMALSSYEYFKAIVDDEKGSETDGAKRCMMDALKTYREASQAALKVFDLCVKLHVADPKNKKTSTKESKGPSLEDLLDDGQ